MSASVSYAAAVSTPNGTLRQPQIQARACSDPDLRASLEAPAKPQRPGAGIRSKTSFRGWPKKSEKSASNQPGPVQEVRHSGQFPRAEHTPNTEHAEEHVYVLTLKITDSLSTPMNEMREKYFPKKLNRTPAHLTLFHALPHSQLEVLLESLRQMSTSMKPFDVSTGKPFRMRKGVGINVDAGYKIMKDVHEQFRSQWLPFLSEQDAGGFRPHWTVMNKMDDEKEVDLAFDSIRRELSENNQEGQALGLDLWQYNRGNWTLTNEYPFGEIGKTPSKTQTFESPKSRGGHVASKKDPLSEQTLGVSSKRPGMWKRGSSVGDALKSMSFRGKS